MVPGPHISIIFVYFRRVQRAVANSLEARAEGLKGAGIALELLDRHRAAAPHAGKKRLELVG